MTIGRLTGSDNVSGYQKREEVDKTIIVEYNNLVQSLVSSNQACLNNDIENVNPKEASLIVVKIADLMHERDLIK